MQDELKIYRGSDYVVSKHIVIHQPTLGEICDYGEQKYYSMVHQFCSTPQNLKWQLWDIGIDYTEITPFELFCLYIYKSFTKDETSIIFGDLDFTKFKLRHREDGSLYLYQEVERNENQSFAEKKRALWRKFMRISGVETPSEDNDVDIIIIDEFTYKVITDYLCNSHVIEQDLKVPANESTKMILIEDAKEEYEMNKHKKISSQLKNLISAMVNCEGFKMNHTDVWDLKISAFMDSVKRISKIKNANLLLQSGYSGFGINLKEIDKKQLDWLGEI